MKVTLELYGCRKDAQAQLNIFAEARKRYENAIEELSTRLNTERMHTASPNTFKNEITQIGSIEGFKCIIKGVVKRQDKR